MIIAQRREARVAAKSLALARSLGAARGRGLSTPAGAATGDLGFAGRCTSADDSVATGEEPESKLWCNCGAGATFGSSSRMVVKRDDVTRHHRHADLALGSP